MSMWTRTFSGLRQSQISAQAKRFLNLQEYQSKQLMGEAGLTVQRFIVVDSEKDCNEKIKKFDAAEYVVKAQVLAGGRGKGHFPKSGLQGGVKLTTKKDEVTEWVGKMVGYNLVSKQTPPEGVNVKTVMIAESVDITRETYVAVLLDRETYGPVMVVSPAGGMDIESVAENTPELIFKEPIDIRIGITDEQANRLATDLKFEGVFHKPAADQLKGLYNLFMKVDSTQIEINPLAETSDKRVFCIDAKLNFDDSAQFRQKRIFDMDDHAEDDPREVAASKFDLNYVGMDGNIACMVNGAGLAMATMDIIKLYGGDPANFLDVGGTVNEQSVEEAFKIITTDPKVKAILVNIFGGIVNCETIANGLTSAFKKLALNVPLVVRLEGTNVNEAKETLKKSGLPIIAADDLADAAQKAIACLK